MGCNHTRPTGTILRLIGVALVLTFSALSASAQPAPAPLIPHATWDCGMPAGIPSPEAGRPVFEIEIPLERTVEIGRTPYGLRRVTIGLEGSIEGSRLAGTVAAGALDLQLVLTNATVEIEQALVLQASDGSYIYARNAGAGPDAGDVRVVMDFEAPNESQHAWLNTGITVGSGNVALSIAKPADVAAQPWGYRVKEASEQQGEMLITENVTLASSQRVGPSKRGNRNIIPITGGTVSGRIQGRVLMGGADYQILTPPASIDAHYLWETDDGELIIVRNGGGFGALVPTFETRVDGPYAFLNTGSYLSSNPSMGQGGVALSFFESVTTTR